ncbi:RNA polymerase, sigma-24 subunit, ECF subfamily [Kribbella flavida DSM 17836]|uniref:RNA polymerase, sigma-24 subunit, ECF subfamily n=1 Tax=Kribbella flavida (strain DSM 17836 / JCM 10339 / NBRC 14399) TaxID=479435 RepID=D2PL26_KRIFD|nr:RNA polymerase subunit sigma-70 [Kribbella flavida]ADB34281.1 RNA polymerase, sigma-24 subunit, ECF subfamily [Kribbella flavida DSM 17836]
MTPQTMADEDFVRLVAPYRAELLAHCRRLLHDPADAEDQLQETLLRAWRSYGDFQGRSSLRTWLYRIATNVCLTALDRSGRVPQPVGLPTDTDQQPVNPLLAPPRLTVDPADLMDTREDSRRAMLVAWTHLSAQQRAVLVLADVMSWPAADIADLLGTSSAAVYSMLRRARRSLAEGRTTDTAGGPPAEVQPRLLDAYALAFENGDTDSLLNLLTEDAVYEQHPGSTRLAGRAGILRFLAYCPAFGQSRLVPVTIDDLPGFAVYRVAPDGAYRAHNLDVLTTDRSGFRHIEVIDDRTLFQPLGLPLTLPDDRIRPRGGRG